MKEATFKEYMRFKKHFCINGNAKCNKCPIKEEKVKYNIISCNHFEYKYTDVVAKIITKWCEEHPPKTYLDDFKEKFPNYKGEYHCLDMICRKTIYNGGGRHKCNLNCKQCWNEKMEE